MIRAAENRYGLAKTKREEGRGAGGESPEGDMEPPTAYDDGSDGEVDDDSQNWDE